jgi:hypothetical protein
MQFMASFNKVMIYYLYTRALGFFSFTNARIGTAFPCCFCYNIYWKPASFRGIVNVKLGRDAGYIYFAIRWPKSANLNL